MIYRMVGAVGVDSPDGLVAAQDLRTIQALPLGPQRELPPFCKAKSTLVAREPPEGWSNLGEGR